AVSLPTLPRRLAVVGAGPIGVEFAQMFHRFGVEVTVLQRSPLPLPTEDREMSDLLCDLLSREGVRMKTGLEPKCLPSTARGKKIELRGPAGEKEELLVDEILVSTGRRPSLAALDLQAAGVEATA